MSNRTKRKFDAHLTFDAPTGKIGFEFEPRPDKKPASTVVNDTGAPTPPAKKKPAKKAAKKVAKKAAQKSNE